MDEKPVSFEEKLQAVQDMITSIESGKLSLEDSVRQYEAGMKMLGNMDRELGEITRRLSVLREGKEEPYADA